MAILLSLLSLALRQPAHAQVSAPDTAATAAAVVVAGRAYAAALGTDRMLYDGPEYVDYTTPGTRGHQFLEQPRGPSRQRSVPRRHVCGCAAELRFAAR
ncbi:MAG: hypothetical protein WKG07_28680 [Hymenobacter sp.]